MQSIQAVATDNEAGIEDTGLGTAAKIKGGKSKLFNYTTIL